MPDDNLLIKQTDRRTTKQITFSSDSATHWLWKALSYETLFWHDLVISPMLLIILLNHNHYSGLHTLLMTLSMTECFLIGWSDCGQIICRAKRNTHPTCQGLHNKQNTVSLICILSQSIGMVSFSLYFVSSSASATATAHSTHQTVDTQSISLKLCFTLHQKHLH